MLVNFYIGINFEKFSRVDANIKIYQHYDYTHYITIAFFESTCMNRLLELN